MRAPILCLLACGLLVSACGGGRDRTGRPTDPNNRTPAPRCGDGEVQTGEVCDATRLGDLTCETLGYGPGVLACGGDCRDFDRRGCGAPATCGNGVKDGNELCDGGDMGGLTCQSFGFTEGTLTCFPNCGFVDRSGCSGAAAACGNGTREGAERCDGTDLGGASCESLGLGAGALTCAPTCAGYDTSGCSGGCAPECGARECGPDPACGVSCGTCAEGTCNAQGRCEVAAPSAPRILNFGTNVSQLTRGESVRFSAIVTDPDGIGDLIGGSLETDAGRVYGTFATSDNEGAYSFDLSWNEMNQVVPIDFESEEQRTFVARFYDVAGDEATASVQVRLHCNGDGACAGRCRDLMEDRSNCGSCGRQCPGELICSQGTCAGIVQPIPGQACQQACPSVLPMSSCVVNCDLGDGSGTVFGGAGLYYCSDGPCGTSEEVRAFTCTEPIPMSYAAPDGSTMQLNSGGCCCVVP